MTIGGFMMDPYPAYGQRMVNNTNSPSDASKNLKAEEGQKTKGVTGGECQTCKERKYVDGSNEGNVSFKAPGHISPESSAAKVKAHESEHVANAVKEGNKENKKLISSSVSLQTSVCPECGRSYVSGGTTKTTMATYSDNPYDQSRKILEGSMLAGQNIDYAA